MAKSSTIIKKVQTDLVDILGELQLVNQPVKIKVVRKLEDAEEFSPLDI